MKAWLHYYGNPKDQVEDPAYLRALYYEGIEYERQIYADRYSDAFKVPASKDKEKRKTATINAMKDGIPVILQGYLYDQDTVGVLDFLELVSTSPESGTGHIYRVGEIKSSARLYTSQIMQACWYTDLLSNVQNHRLDEVNFITKGGGQQIIFIDKYNSEYQAIKKELLALRQTQLPPKPHLIKSCKSCHWRGICMKELIENKHVSLVPGISVDRANILESVGILDWEDLGTTSCDLLMELGFLPYEIEQIEHSIDCLLNNSPPLHYSLQSDIFENTCVIVLEFPELAAQRQAGLRPIPTKIYYESVRDQIDAIDVRKTGEQLTADLSPLINGEKLTFYGSTDSGSFLRISRENGYRFRSYLDIFSIIENIVHVPAPGIELDALYGYITNTQHDELKGKERVRAIREVINWISRSL
ncbi:MAG: Dna2/Cas4 domain-containing protein [Candidatus Helarchaeota archaeon]